MKPLHSPRKFQDVYKNNPGEALVWAVDGSYTTAEKALKINEDIEKQGLIAGLAIGRRVSMDNSFYKIAFSMR
jgi:hypothetical protein